MLKSKLVSSIHKKYPSLNPNEIESISNLFFKKIILALQEGKKIEIQVGESQNKNSDEIFIIAEIDKATVYLGEQITLKYKLYKRADISIAGIDQFKMPDFIGFWAEEIFTPQRLQFQTQVVTYKGMKYQVANLGERALFPIASDLFSIV